MQLQVKFLYFNAANFAVKSTVEAGSENLVILIQLHQIDRNENKKYFEVTLAADLAADLSASGGEVTAKLNTDQWVVVRLINSK